MNISKNINKIIFLFAAAMVLQFLPAIPVKAANVGDAVNFNVDPNYDANANSQINATLVNITSSLYFYVQTDWWNSQTKTQQSQDLTDFNNLSNEFTGHIYPVLTSTYGSDWNPTIDPNDTITILFESMNNDLGGYFRSDDEYSNLQVPDSNQTEMIYLPIDQINSSQLKVFLAHEFIHLIVFNQKNRLEGVQEDTWLSEARSDYASTLLGYDDVYEGSNLQRRVEDFLEEPNDSLTEWLGTKYDYAVEDLFTHYLVDHYGIDILTDSLHSKLVGIPSINAALLQNGYKDTFSQIFTNWTITLVINDCSQNPEYCYINKDLTDLKISPNLIFLPLVGNSSLSLNNVTKNWAGNWQKIIGGDGDLTLQFSSLPGLNFQVPYVVYDNNNNYVVKFLQLDSSGKGEIDIQNFGSDYSSLVIIPTLQSEISGFDQPQLSYPYTFTVSVVQPQAPEDPTVIQNLQNQIATLKEEIVAAQAKNGVSTSSNICAALTTNLYVGILDKSDVNCLQSFLKSQGASIYPQGFITGNFGSLTKAAVIRFQKQYDIPQTGFVGILTRTKINTLLNSTNNGG